MACPTDLDADLLALMALNHELLLANLHRRVSRWVRRGNVVDIHGTIFFGISHDASMLPGN